MLVGKMEAAREPLVEELTPKLADWEARNPYPLLGQWQVLDPVSFSATDSKETELVKQEDGSLLVPGRQSRPQQLQGRGQELAARDHRVPDRGAQGLDAAEFGSGPGPSREFRTVGSAHRSSAG